MAGAALAALYSFVDGPVLQTDARTAEMAKYAANAFLAMRVSFANEMASVAEAAGADVACMMHAVGLDPRIGSRYLSPGIGYGGSCLNKDLTALIEFGSEMRQPMLLSKATCAVNEARRDTVLSLLHERLGGLRGRRIALIGMAFKPGTNDIRDAPAVYLASRLQEQGAELQAWDPCVTAGQLTSMPNVELTHHLYEAFENADAAVLCTEWPEALEADLSRVAAIMRGSLLIDGRYGWSPQEARREGLCVLRIGATGTEIS
jgi:UDPglucose 6-dehydrogenase